MSFHISAGYLYVFLGSVCSGPLPFLIKSVDVVELHEFFMYYGHQSLMASTVFAPFK